MFCRKCAELCHPKRYGGAFLHPHEQEECIRAVAVGDKSRITIDDTFHLPSNYFYEEDYVKVKNLTIPGSLSTNDYAKTIKPAPQITIDTNSYDNSRGLVKVVQQEKYEVNQVVVFDDPFSSKSGYGIIISEWDHRNSTESTPAILRGDNSKYYYIIQMLGCTDNFWLLDRIYNGYKDALNLMKIEKEKKIFPKIELLQDNSASSVSNSDTSKSLQLGPLLDDDYRYAYQDARLIDKRITEMQSLKLLGPKFHLRKVRYDPLITELEAASRPEKFNIDGRLPISSIERSTLSTLQQQPLLLQRQERLKAIQEQKQKEKEEIMIIRRQSSNYFGSYDEAVSEYGSISRSYSNVFNKSTDIYGNGGAIRNNNSVSIDLVNENYQRSIRNLQVGSLDEHDNYNAVGRSGNVIAKSHSAQYNNDDSGIIPNSFAYTNGEYLDSNEISNSNGNDDGVPYFVHAYQTLLASYKTDKENADEEAKANVQQVSPAHKEKEPKTKEELAAERQLALYHRSIYGDHAPEKRKLKMNSEVYELVDVNIYAGIDIDDQSQLPINHEEQEPLTANLRSYEDTVQYDVKNEIDLDRFDALSLEDGNNAVGLINTYDSVVSINGKKQIMQRSLRVLVMGESDFISLEEKVQQLKDRRIGILKALVSGTAGINDWKRVGKRFKTWKKNMKFLKKQQYHYNARKIQTTVRRWLCRVSNSPLLFCIV